MTPGTGRATRLPLFGIFLLALVLRLVGIGWGLPDLESHWLSYHPDEFTHVNAAGRVLLGSFNPHLWDYGTLTVYVHETLGVLRFAKGDDVTRVMRLAVTYEVGPHRLVCREIESKSAGSTTTLLMTPEVPGRVVFKQTTSKRDRAAVRIVEELVGFTKK